MEDGQVPDLKKKNIGDCNLLWSFLENLKPSLFGVNIKKMVLLHFFKRAPEGLKFANGCNQKENS